MNVSMLYVNIHSDCARVVCVCACARALVCVCVDVCLRVCRCLCVCMQIVCILIYAYVSLYEWVCVFVCMFTIARMYARCVQVLRTSYETLQGSCAEIIISTPTVITSTHNCRCR